VPTAKVQKKGWFFFANSHDLFFRDWLAIEVVIISFVSKHWPILSQSVACMVSILSCPRSGICRRLEIVDISTILGTGAQGALRRLNSNAPDYLTISNDEVPKAEVKPAHDAFAVNVNAPKMS